MTQESLVLQLAQSAKTASRVLALANTKLKDKALALMAQALRDNQAAIIRENEIDLERGKATGLSLALSDRLKLDGKRIQSMVQGLEELIKLPDPVGEVLGSIRRPNGLEVSRVRVPLGVVGIIYEARPNVTADAAGLCLKSGNAVILRGGSEAINSNRVIANLLARAVAQAGLPGDCVKILDDTSHEAIYELLKLEDYIDVIIPRGGEKLIRSVTEHSRIPVIKHYKGVCHVYVDNFADLDMAQKIAYNAKVQRPGVCNAMETLLVDVAIAGQFLPKMLEQLQQAKVEIRGCPRTQKLGQNIQPATEDDWYAEYLDLILAVKVVDGLDAAIEHIAKYGSQHSEAIVTNNYRHARRFQQEVDSSAVFVNASTRFNDGGEFGLGAEIGISTQKLHARGPMGLAELTSTKFVVWGDGQVRE
ncbi:MAG: glutamate-5-semialdehyde dehydrogenase [Candidatus Schekmanbacteria bacterium]|nr:glutamate-5-semialdehyde dehydrogenase [Candidatus Schekmanbacteria bacterium]